MGAGNIRQMYNATTKHLSVQENLLQDKEWLTR